MSRGLGDVYKRQTVDTADQPWLTRTDADADAFPPPPEPPPSPEPPPRRRPPSDYRVTGGDISRTDEIAGGENDRPWIALPIEPDEPDTPPER